MPVPSPTLPQPAPSQEGTLEARHVLARLTQGRASSGPGFCGIMPGSRSGAPPVWKLTRPFPIQAYKHPPAGCLFSPKRGSLPHVLWTGLPRLGAKCFLDVFAQGLFPLSWLSARKPKHTGEGPKPHQHVQPRGCSVLGALLASVLLWPLHWNYDPGLLGERYGCRFLQTAKGYNNENYLKGERALYGFSSCGLNESFKAAQRESGSLCQDAQYAASHTEVSPEEPRIFLTDWGSLELSYRAKTSPCGFAFPCQYASPSSGLAREKQPLRKYLQEALFPPAWEVHVTGGSESEPPAGKKRHPVGPCLEASIWKEWVSFSRRKPLDLLRKWKFQSLDRFSPAFCQPCKDIPRF